MIWLTVPLAVVGVALALLLQMPGTAALLRDAAASVKRMKGRIQGRLILDTEGTRRPAAAKTSAGTARATPAAATTTRKKAPT